MEAVTIPVQRREKVGTRATRTLRGEGFVPGVLYGHGIDSVPIALPEKSIEHCLHHHVRIMKLDFGDESDQALIKDLQWDAIGEKLLHIDLIRVSMDEVVSMAIPLESIGRAKGVEEGGILEIHRTEIQIRCLPTQIPDVIPYDVSDLGLQKSLHIKDIILPEGVSLDDDPDHVVASIVVRVETEVPEAEEEEAPAEGDEAAEGEKAEEDKGDA